mmetsp:Transcript_4462/g.7108  ORF Transcript_4462/g.7108 Transcript_4462/m.7108 type:complete len:170 (-) Transcript_4462:254-763(-)
MHIEYLHMNSPEPSRAIESHSSRKPDAPVGSSHITTAKLQSLYHLPISKAAKTFGISVRTFQRHCKRHQMRRWPYRQIRSINGKVETLLCKAIQSQDNEEIEACKATIELLQMKKIFVMMAATWKSNEAYKVLNLPAESLANEDSFSHMIEIALRCTIEEVNALVVKTG